MSDLDDFKDALMRYARTVEACTSVPDMNEARSRVQALYATAIRERDEFRRGLQVACADLEAIARTSSNDYIHKARDAAIRALRNAP